MSINDSAIIIQWNAAEFNDIPVIPSSKNSVTGQTVQAIITHFMTIKGTNIYRQNMIFLFRINDNLE